jgi:hypothetical protein
LTSITSVLDWGAVGDGHTDNTAAFRAALDSVANGGIVFVPAGQYSFDGTLSMPTATSLVGTYVTVPSHEVDQGAQAPTDGSILMPRGGRGSENGSAFISVAEDCTLKGFTIYYPDQAPNAAPAPYPWTISMSGNNAAVQDVELLNPWNGISAVGAARHYIARVQGQPANIGIYVDETYDIGRIENVHWNPWYSVNAAYIAHQTVFGQGFVFARTDWEYVLNTFVFAMSVGYRFVESPSGSCNGNFLGIGADCCQNASVLVDAADPWGILITNGKEGCMHTRGLVRRVALCGMRVADSATKSALQSVSRSGFGDTCAAVTPSASMRPAHLPTVQASSRALLGPLGPTSVSTRSSWSPPPIRALCA